LDDLLSSDTEGLSAGSKDPQVVCLAEKHIGEDRAGVEKVLTVVEDEQQPLRGDVVDQPGHRPKTRFVTEPHRCHDRFGDELGIAEAAELHQLGAVGNGLTS
jgi:hypothetical protein